ncbi:glycosyltransferase family 2 protein [Bizionia hallyeonensis]|uniref:Glycosyltransferase family 2 protein n=1 Tax=Bizionia hallyeonensis TaxID=1123757 RepID=A0ABW0C6V4_9FLAO
MKNLVSIIIPVFNRATLLAETLDSVLAQSFTQWECLVVDDGSTDGTDLLVRTICEKDSRFCYIQRPQDRQKGASTCRNIGLELAKGTYILFFDSDDVLPPDVLASRMQVVLAQPEYDFYVFQTARFYHPNKDPDAIWNDLRKPNSHDLADFLSVNPVWHTSGPIWRKDFLVHNGLHFTEGVRSWQDWEFHIRVLLHNPNYLKLDTRETMVLQRFHEEAAIHKLNSSEDQQNRIHLFFLLIEAFKVHQKFDGLDVQKHFFKLFYFVIQQMAFSDLDPVVWQRIREELYLVPKLDMAFWKVYVHFNARYTGAGKYRLYGLLKRIKHGVFSKRFAVDDFSGRTWYTLKLN